MCVIVVCKEGMKPPLKTIKKCWEENPHGAGIGLRKNGKLLFYKGFMKLHDLETKLNKLSDYEEMVIHFRLASAGGISSYLTHPFSNNIITYKLNKGKDKFLLFHNGHDFQLAKIADKYKLSDSAIAAIMVENQENPKELLKKYSGKFVCMSNTVTELIGQFYDEGGILFSNTFWKFKTNWQNSWYNTHNINNNWRDVSWNKTCHNTNSYQSNYPNKTFNQSNNLNNTSYRIWEKICPTCDTKFYNDKIHVCPKCKQSLAYKINVSCPSCFNPRNVNLYFDSFEAERECSKCKTKYKFSIELNKTNKWVTIKKEIIELEEEKNKTFLECTKCKAKNDDSHSMACPECGNRSFIVIREKVDTARNDVPLRTIKDNSGAICEICKRELNIDGKCIVCDE
jgi:hypothetical protein